MHCRKSRVSPNPCNRGVVNATPCPRFKKITGRKPCHQQRPNEVNIKNLNTSTFTMCNERERDTGAKDRTRVG
eukprot:m.106229 g.106229  ORF g.106229 m.106229 type:complete len:73 (-) comp27704_c0_seq5:22-240(-)